jgi:hypothetical protein
MTPQISKALSSGFTSKQIMDFILKKFPQHKSVIQNALATGFTTDQVLKFLSGGKKALSMPEEQTSEGSTEFQQTRNRDISRRENVNKKTLQGAALAATPLASQAVGSALARSLPPILNKLAPGVPNSIAASLTGQNIQGQAPLATQTTTPQNMLPSQQPPISNQVAPNIAQPQQAAQPEGIINPKEYLQKLGIKDKVDDLLKRGNSPEQAAATLGMQRGAGKVSGQIDPELLANIDAYSKQAKPDQEKASTIVPKEEEKIIDLGGMGKGITANLYEGLFESLKKGSSKFAGIEDPLLKRAKPLFDSGKIKSAEDLQKFANEKPSVAKNETVMSPHGVAEVKEIRNGQAIIDIDGKLHKVKEDELESSPLPEKDLADLYDELIQGIEGETGEDVSRMVQWAGYNPETNTLQFLPHTGKLYKYGNISPEDAALLTDILSTRKTSGENFIGAWKKDSKSPIGAALSKLIRKLQTERGGKGQEYEETHEPIYSAYEPAIQAAKKKKKKK